MCLSLTLSARIYETVEQCDKRYGKPYKKQTVQRYYESNGLFIVAHFYKNKCYQIDYGSARVSKDLPFTFNQFLSTLGYDDAKLTVTKGNTKYYKKDSFFILRSSNHAIVVVDLKIQRLAVTSKKIKGL